jgi:hypothetical protein
MRLRTFLTILVLAGLSACAWGYDGYYGGYYGVPYGQAAVAGPGPVYHGGAWAEPRPVRAPFEGELTGPGLAQLDDWLKDTPEGRAIVTLGFTDAAGGVISAETADRANIWFRRYADSNHDMTITDPEIRTALVAAAGRYRHRPQG